VLLLGLNGLGRYLVLFFEDLLERLEPEQGDIEKHLYLDIFINIQ